MSTLPAGCKPYFAWDYQCLQCTYNKSVYLSPAHHNKIPGQLGTASLLKILVRNGAILVKTYHDPSVHKRINHWRIVSGLVQLRMSLE